MAVIPWTWIKYFVERPGLLRNSTSRAAIPCPQIPDRLHHFLFICRVGVERGL